MSNDRIIVLCSRIQGMLDTLSPELIRRAAQNSPGLEERQRQVFEELAKCQEAILAFKPPKEGR